ncbi:MAG: capsular biosynthesis protein [Massilibacteroides sp.]|nr:capsular biosynthesis protein [Massilibacteroides sp.]
MIQTFINRIRGQQGILDGFLEGMTDCHSHLLPCVDDGFRKEEKTLKALAYQEDLGVKQIWLTPHMMIDYPNNIASNLRPKFDQLKQAYKGPIALFLGGEYMLDTGFEKHLASQDLLCFLHNKLLVETSYFSPPFNYGELIFKLKTQGYSPLLAHPERYMYLEKEDYLTYKEEGYSFQLNLMSLAGVYGVESMKKAKWLLENDMYSCVGTDMHRLDIWKRSLTRILLNRKQKNNLAAILTI